MGRSATRVLHCGAELQQRRRCSPAHGATRSASAALQSRDQPWPTARVKETRACALGNPLVEPRRLVVVVVVLTVCLLIDANLCAPDCGSRVPVDTAPGPVPMCRAQKNPSAHKVHDELLRRLRSSTCRHADGHVNNLVKELPKLSRSG